MAGLIDSHRQLWQTSLRGLSADLIAPEYRHQLREALVPLFTPEDVFAATLAGALDAIECGVTTVGDWGHIMNSPEHADAAIAALRASGIRAVFAHTPPNDHEAPKWWADSDRPHPRDAARVRKMLSDDGALVTMGFGARAPQLVQREVRVHDWNLARELGVRIIADGGIGGGLWGGRKYPIRLLSADDLLGPDTTYVHCNNLMEDEYRLIADSGGAISMTPCAELHVGFGMPATAAALRHGLKPAIGIDSVIFVAGDLFGTMRSTLGLLRGMLGWQATQQERGVEPWEITTGDVLEFATANGAAALGLKQTGTLAVGKKADVVLLDAGSARLAPASNPIATVVLQASAADVHTVLIGGRVVKRAGVIETCDHRAAISALCASRDRLLREGGERLGAAVARRLTSSSTALGS
jgi:cytosine/adenosine deaminase-related metal-dependent hydrolase